MICFVWKWMERLESISAFWSFFLSGLSISTNHQWMTHSSNDSFAFRWDSWNRISHRFSLHMSVVLGYRLPITGIRLKGMEGGREQEAISLHMQLQAAMRTNEKLQEFLGEPLELMSVTAVDRVGWWGPSRDSWKMQSLCGVFLRRFHITLKVEIVSRKFPDFHVHGCLVLQFPIHNVSYGECRQSGWPS